MARPIGEVTDNQSISADAPPRSCRRSLGAPNRSRAEPRKSPARGTQSELLYCGYTGNPTSPPESLSASERVIVKHPGLGQGLAARLKKRTELDRIGPVDGKVELRSPVACDPVGNGLDKLVRPKGSARS